VFWARVLAVLVFFAKFVFSPPICTQGFGNILQHSNLILDNEVGYSLAQQSWCRLNVAQNSHFLWTGSF
jgi:hypothetical protein